MSEPIEGAPGWTIERDDEAKTAQARWNAGGGEIVVTSGLTDGLVVEEQLDNATVVDGWTFSGIPDAVLRALGYIRQPAATREGESK